MKVLYENITEYDKREMDKFQAFHEKKSKPYMIYLLFLLVLLIILLIINIVIGNWRWLLGSTILFGILYYYYRYYRADRGKANNMKIKNKKFIFDFYDKQIRITDAYANQYSTTNYFEIERVYETEENFYLYLSQQYSYIINKNNFNIGKLNDFRDFIKKKCLLKYRKKYRIRKSPEEKLAMKKLKEEKKKRNHSNENIENKENTAEQIITTETKKEE